MAKTNVYYATGSSGWDYSSEIRGEPDGVYASEYSDAAQIKYLTCSGFGISDIPENAIITAVKLETKCYSSYSGGSVGIIARISGVNQGTYVTKTGGPATIIENSYTSGALLDATNLVNGVFDVMVRGSLPTAGYWNYADYLKVSVIYELPIGGLEMGCAF